MFGWGLVRKISKIISLTWEVKFLKIYREANRCVDAIASLACSQKGSLIFLEHFPSSIEQLRPSDRLGIVSPRYIYRY